MNNKIKSKNARSQKRETVNEIEKISSKCRIRALGLIRHFFNILKIDKDVIDMLEKIEVTIDYKDQSDFIAMYNTYYNTLTISGKYSIEYMNSYNEKDFLFITTTTFIHEYLHALRGFLLKYVDGIPSSEYDDYVTKYESIINGKHMYERKVLSIIEDNKTYKFVIYDYKNNCFEEITILKTFFDYLDKEKLLKYYNNISRKLYVNLCLISAKHKFIKSENSDIKNVCRINDEIYRGKEEFLVSAFSNIIILHENKTKYDPSIVEYGIKSLKDKYDLIGCYIIKRMSLDDIKWFFTSYMYDEYNDRLRDIFQERYDIILNKANVLYRYACADSYETKKVEELKRCIRLINK